MAMAMAASPINGGGRAFYRLTRSKCRDQARFGIGSEGSAGVSRCCGRRLDCGVACGEVAIFVELINSGCMALKRGNCCDLVTLRIGSGGCVGFPRNCGRGVASGAMAMATLPIGTQMLRRILELRIEGRGSGRVGRISGRNRNGGARVRGSSSVNSEGISGAEDGGIDDAAMWLRENLPLQLERDGVGNDASRRIAEACADACARFLATRRAFDPVMIMDAMEEEIERRDLRSDQFLPFELGRRAAKVLTERWNALPVAERPTAYHQQMYVNKKDVVDFDKWPENLKLP